jgi:hypothetical protein
MKGLCSTEGCCLDLYCRGLCKNCYYRAKYHGTLENIGPTKLILPRGHPFRESWVHMKRRCNDKNCVQYRWYGGVGISYTPAWETLTGFYNDMFVSWLPKATLDRIDCHDNYYKENCRWVAKGINSRYKRNTKLTEQRAEEIRKLYATGKHTQAQIAKAYDVDQTVVSNVVTGRSWT